jgi:hypothetical protein
MSPGSVSGVLSANRKLQNNYHAISPQSTSHLSILEQITRDH